MTQILNHQCLLVCKKNLKIDSLLNKTRFYDHNFKNNNNFFFLCIDMSQIQ